MALRAVKANDEKLASHLTSAQHYLARGMGEEMLELLRAAASPGGLQIGSINWLIANLEQHGFIIIDPVTHHRQCATITKAGQGVISLRPHVHDA